MSRLSDELLRRNWIDQGSGVMQLLGWERSPESPAAAPARSTSGLPGDSGDLDAVEASGCERLTGVFWLSLLLVGEKVQAEAADGTSAVAHPHVRVRAGLFTTNLRGSTTPRGGCHTVNAVVAKKGCRRCRGVVLCMRCRARQRTDARAADSTGAWSGIRQRDNKPQRDCLMQGQQNMNDHQATKSHQASQECTPFKESTSSAM